MKDFRALSYQILQYANQGIIRIKFQQEVCRIIIHFTKCDGVEFWLKDHGKYFRCKAEASKQNPLFFEILSYKENEIGINTPNSVEDLKFFNLCKDAILGKMDSSLPILRRFKSFWISEAKRFPTSRRGSSHKIEPGVSPLDKDYQSIGWLPISVENKNLGLLVLKSKRRKFFKEEEIENYENFCQILGMAIVHRHAQADLRERIKELTCLFQIANLAANPNISLEEILQSIVEILPQAWLYPEITVAEVMVDGRSYLTHGFQEGRSQLISDIIVSGEIRGRIRVIYLEEKPELDEGPFLKEERNLIDAVSREIAIIINRKEVERDKLKLQEQLRHADRLATIGQLVAGIAHELNEPLGNILGFAQLAKKCPGLPDQAEKDIEKILSASLNAREIVKKFLIFARKIPPKKTKVNLNRIIEEGLRFFESRCAKEGIEVIPLLSPVLPEIYADPSQLNQVFVNLVVNALQAMPMGGKLTIQTLSEKDHVLLIVEDTGVGMRKEVLKQIFTPFFTTKDVGHGTGLGLPVVHGIVTSHGGFINVESQPNKGSRFEIRLPIVGPEETEWGGKKW